MTEPVRLIRALLQEAGECEWLEFKHNNGDPERTGEYISALSNAAALHGQPMGYLLWGVADGRREPVGTTFEPTTARVGNEPLEPWLSRLLTPRLDFRFVPLELDGLHMVLLEVPAAREAPTRFKGREYVRVGSTTRSLHDHPEKERALWDRFGASPFERDVALSAVESSRVLELLDYPAYFTLTNQPLPEGRDGILEKLGAEAFILPRVDGRFDITNLGALLFARELAQFERLGRKALRVVFYKGVHRVETEREQTGTRGYAAGYEGAVRFLNERLPRNELMGQALRREVPMYPELALREMVANALIHQDLRISGAGPMVEVFADRIEIGNPGAPLNDLARLLDMPPRSRNEALASFMRRIGVCEERGSGIDKVIFEIEKYQLPPPDFRIAGDNTVAVLFAPKRHTAMAAAERVRACYQHACLMYVSNQRMTNASLRTRFGIEAANAATVSRFLAEALRSGVIRLGDPEGKSTKDRWYLPTWA